MPLSDASLAIEKTIVVILSAARIAERRRGVGTQGQRVLVPRIFRELSFGDQSIFRRITSRSRSVVRKHGRPSIGCFIAGFVAVGWRVRQAAGCRQVTNVYDDGPDFIVA
jgi:hypothetical protein